MVSHVQLTVMKHRRLSMEHFSYPMADKLLNYTILEFVCMVPIKIENFSQVEGIKFNQIMQTNSSIQYTSVTVSLYWVLVQTKSKI
jgi:hypothetical protein